MKKHPLSQELEYAALYAIVKGVAETGVVEEAELSKPGRLVHRAVLSLAADGKTPPFDLTSVGLVCIEVLGTNRTEISTYIREMQTAVVGIEIKDILAKVRAKQVLVELINEAGGMLQRGILDTGLLSTVITRSVVGTDLKPLAESLSAGFPAPPVGVSIDSLPTLTEATGGLMGLWAISGEPGVGKTGISWQIALDVSQKMSVIYYDFENGELVLVDRTRQMVGGNIERARSLTERVYYRDSIRTLDADLAMVAPPALLVVDSVQKLPGSIEHRKASLDKWVHKLEYLKKRGYHVLLVSEVARAQYNQDAYIGAFKETGEIEYSADVGMQLLPGTDNMVEVYIVKNRHRPTRGFVTLLSRVSSWRFKELSRETT